MGTPVVIGVVERMMLRFGGGVPGSPPELHEQRRAIAGVVMVSSAGLRLLRTVLTCRC